MVRDLDSMYDEIKGLNLIATDVLKKYHNFECPIQLKLSKHNLNKL